MTLSSKSLFRKLNLSKHRQPRLYDCQHGSNYFLSMANLVQKRSSILKGNCARPRVLGCRVSYASWFLPLILLSGGKSKHYAPVQAAGINREECVQVIITPTTKGFRGTLRNDGAKSPNNSRPSNNRHPRIIAPYSLKYLK